MEEGAYGWITINYLLEGLIKVTNGFPVVMENLQHFLLFQKTSLNPIYKLFSSWGPKDVSTSTRISDIAIFWGTFCPHYLGFNRTTQTHT